MAKEVTRADLQRLWKDWQRQADVAFREQTDPAVSRDMKRVAAMKIRTLDTCVADLRELTEGTRPHPVKRRESD